METVLGHLFLLVLCFGALMSCAVCEISILFYLLAVYATLEIWTSWTLTKAVS